MTVNHPQFGTTCCICFNSLKPEDCAVDTRGECWDVCKGKCAEEAGITENQICWAPRQNVKGLRRST